MTHTKVALLLTTAALAIAGALPSGGMAFSPSACNQGTEHAHHTVPQGNPAHAHIPECE